MTKVSIQYKGKGLESIKVSGHAGTNVKGKDLVCAAVSAITFGALNAINDIDADFDYEIDADEPYICLSPKGAISDHDETVLETLIIQLKTIQASYPEAISIQERK